MTRRAGRRCWCVQEVELLLHLWDKAWEGLAQAEACYEQGGRRRRPRHTVGARCNCIGARPQRAPGRPSAGAA